jgi:tyrosine-protein phosphatase YwqE
VIDLHCHILPGLDDGALNLHDAIGMARQAQDDGIQAVCATPHIRHDHDVVISELADRVPSSTGSSGAAASARA